MVFNRSKVGRTTMSVDVINGEKVRSIRGVSVLGGAGSTAT